MIEETTKHNIGVIMIVVDTLFNFVLFYFRIIILTFIRRIKDYSEPT